ncbi:hypothetical protein POM88_022059 [Heracleum sosnowskyi]|uniref:Uncharacterized protein n=1 Tax=Heracleum sosnowskyi TaxID=360622 RepID=A0AAD8IEL6_9APIA|nr:hypothetical protein POM88_022059 [Heracleum sosnowskyi]
MIDSKKVLRKKGGDQEDFSTLDEYRSYLISTFTCLQEKYPVSEERDVFMPEEKPPVQDSPFRENSKKSHTPVAKTPNSEQQHLMLDAGEFHCQMFWLLNDSVPPSLLDLGLENHPDAERPNYYQRQTKNKELLQNFPLSSLNSSLENAVDEFFNTQECKEAVCGPDEEMLLFPDTSKSVEIDDITTMKYLIKFKLNVGPLPFSADDPEPTETQLDCLHAYIEAHLTPWGRHISGFCLRSKLLKLRNMYKNLVAGQRVKPHAQQGFSMHVHKFMVDLLKRTWEQDQEDGANLGR